MDMLDLNNLAVDVALEWKQTPEYLDVTTKLQALKSHPESSAKIAAFEKAKADYAEAERFGRHHPDHSRYASALIGAKTALYSDPLYREYINSLSAFNKITRQFSEAIEKILDSCLVEVKSQCKTGEKNG